MRRQTRPFVVEVRQRRGTLKRNRSIWGDLDLSGIGAEIEAKPDASESPKDGLIDSKAIHVDVEDTYNPLMEHHMADPKDAEPLQTSDEVPATGEAREAKKPASRSKAARTQTKRSARKAATQPAPSKAQSPATGRATRRTYSEKERAHKLDQIEKAIARGETTKSAVRQTGISEQTYYHWKRAAAPASNGGDLKDLLALEGENKRLKTLLAERLRKENAELKKKLGLD